jgi:hypothetical protein
MASNGRQSASWRRRPRLACVGFEMEKAHAPLGSTQSSKSQRLRLLQSFSRLRLHEQLPTRGENSCLVVSSTGQVWVECCVARMPLQFQLTVSSLLIQRTYNPSYLSLTRSSTSFWTEQMCEARDRRVRIWKSRPVVTWASLAKPRRKKTSSVRYNVTLSEVVDSERTFRRHAAVRP